MVSVEVEMVGTAEELIPFGDVVFISKDVAKHYGAVDMIQALTYVQSFRKFSKVFVEAIF